MIKYLSSLCLILFSLSTSFSQTIEDALRYSTIDPAGTAAMMGIGSAAGAIGGDYSTMHINPAGIADFKRSKFVFTPMISSYSSDAGIEALVGNQSSDDKTRFSIGNVGFVNVNRGSGASKMKNFNVAIGFSQLADFNEAIFFEGNNAGSILDNFVIQANGQGEGNLDPFGTQLAAEAGLLIYDANNFEYFSDLDGVPLDQPILKRQTINRSGSMNELNLTMGGNYDDKLNFGFHLGIPFINFEETKVYSEDGPGLEISPFQSMEYVEQLSTSGVGINFKTGIQYKVVPRLRLGAAIHSPTVMNLTDDFNTGLTYTYVDGAPVPATSNSPDGNFRYRVTNPWRFIGSIATVYSMGDIKGFISGDIEILDYANTNFNLGAYSDQIEDIAFGNELNQEINNRLQNAINYRIGTELAYENLRLRAGIGLNQMPYDAEDGNSTEEVNTFNKVYSFGLGFRVESFFMDFAYRRSTTSSGYYPYFNDSGVGNTQVNIDSRANNMAITAGFTF
jgi:long-subunit fatty acid transport protein